MAELRPGSAAHWVTATAAPCTSLYKPVQITSPPDLGPEPSDRYDPAALWWRHEVLHRMVMRDLAATAPPFRLERDAVQARWLAAPPDPVGAFAEADELLARWTAAVAARPSTTTLPGISAAAGEQHLAWEFSGARNRVWSAIWPSR